MYNKPSGTLSKISIGPGIIKIGPSGATPTLDIGFVAKDATIKFKRDKADVLAGSPQIIIERFAAKEEVSIEFTGVEWNMDTLAKSLGDGVTSLSGSTTGLKVGGKPIFNKYALQFQHIMADGSTLTVRAWKVVSSGEVESSINVDNVHEQKLKFDCMDPSALDWAGAALANGQQLIQLELIGV